MRGRNRNRGFTLIELLIVMLIIGVLVGILVPTIARAVRTVRATRTRDLIRNLGLGLEAFKSDFGRYPPSNSESRYPRIGAEKLVYYLRGPGGTGWGVGAGGNMPPFPDTPRPTRTYGPYYQAEEDQLEFDNQIKRYVAFLDYFAPPGRIIYFRAERDSAGRTTYQWNDNNLNNRRDPYGRLNYATIQFFKDCVIKFTDSSSGTDYYYRDDYLLISPGQDGRFGAIQRLEDGSIRLTTRDEGSYDDITNWN